jgi:PEP-CTERM motif
MSTTIFGPQDGVEVDHVQYGVIPEPEPSLLMGLGLAALAWAGRRKQKG